MDTSQTFPVSKLLCPEKVLQILPHPLFKSEAGSDPNSCSRTSLLYVCRDTADAPIDIMHNHLSNQLPEQVLHLVKQTNGPILNLSAGGTDRKPRNVIEFEYKAFTNTDVVGDAHALPFYANTFKGVICMNAFEHYSMPHIVAEEIYRVLAPGAWAIIHTAFIQPEHESPWHFYNCTKNGLANWFRDFSRLEISVSDNFNPVYGISWILSDILYWVETMHGRDEMLFIEGLTVAELAQAWINPNDPGQKTTAAMRIIDKLPNEIKSKYAAGFQLIGYK